MKGPFAFGFAIPSLLAIIATSVYGQGKQVPLLLGAVLLVVAASLAAGGFEIGRQMQPVSSAPIVSRWRIAAAVVLGFFASILSLPVGFLVFARLTGTGAWQPIASGVWFLAFGIACGYVYGPTFRSVASRFPIVRAGERAA